MGMAYGYKTSREVREDIEKADEKKVYCKNCIHYERRKINPLYVCNAPENMIDSWYAAKSEFLNFPQALNYANNCKWFVDKQGEYGE